MKFPPGKTNPSKRLRPARVLAAMLAVAISGPAVQAQDKSQDRSIVLELFSSQGCSSCPPADKLLGEIARQPHVIAWTLPVDYWDYIGWKDTFGKPAHTDRQKAYAKVRGDGQVYTPQIIVNGVAHVVGSDIGAIRAAGERYYGKQGALSVPLKVTEKNGALEVEVGAAPDGTPKQANLMIVRVTRNATVTVGRGENSGRTLEYTNVGRSAARVGEWKGEAQRFTIAPEVAANPEANGWIVLLQAGDAKAPGPILGAVKAPNI